jgi:hypothetical protein
LHSVTSTQDRDRKVLTSTSTGNPFTDNWTAGVVVQIVPGLNAYASTSEGETIRTGSLISRVTFGTPAPPLDIVSPAEQADNPVPNALGQGKEAGLKFELFQRKLTGSIGWFELANGNFIVIDNDRNAADPRNIGTEVDPNPATANPGRRLQVSWNRPIDGIGLELMRRSAISMTSTWTQADSSGQTSRRASSSYSSFGRKRRSRSTWPRPTQAHDSTLLMLGIDANYAHHSTAMHDLALVTNLLNRRSYLHKNFLLETIGDPPSRQIVGR